MAAQRQQATHADRTSPARRRWRGLRAEMDALNNNDVLLEAEVTVVVCVCVCVTICIVWSGIMAHFQRSGRYNYSLFIYFLSLFLFAISLTVDMVEMCLYKVFFCLPALWGEYNSMQSLRNRWGGLVVIFTSKGQNHSAVVSLSCQKTEWHRITWMITNNSLAGSRLKSRQRCNYRPLWQTALSYNRIITCSFDTKPVSPDHSVMAL